ncbi:hypothetical protein UFOVP1329_14 [uncultured Caudovirales phage]|uniref:Ubiquitin-activating enzyme E1, FCCH domain containing protein n=1 Tax=uncultured Caudovirales phage TaxID=2100421 RepID=A0A6J5SVQ7_9CAUD|nr:hypothetical protein UFOVP1150_39 [uncultured Caudovirales phage]CAB4199013.1 hypothetical protein UFOVP1329_14 [uncultured Caudovirales phage]CAB4218527.1 hypothetical protein UFOVP1595_22 [uncultured Caudovirales phage]
MKALINSFNSGEVTPLVVGRVDMETMRRACRSLKNFIPRVFGGAFRRPSMMYLGEAAVPDQHARLLPFAYSTEKKFIIELGHLVARVHDADTGDVLAGPFASPWTAAQVDAVSYTQVNNVMWLVHPAVAPHELTRVTNSSWTLDPMPWSAQNAFPPMMDENVGATKLSVAATTGSGVLMSSTTPIFDAAHVGSYWRIGHFRDSLSSELTFAPDPLRSGETANVSLSAQTWKIETTGQWAGTVYIEKWNATDGDYDVVEQRENSTGNQVSVTGYGTGLFRLRVRDVTISPAVNVTFKIGIWNGAAIVSPQTITMTPPAYLTANGSELRVTGSWQLTTYGRWAGDMFVEEKNAAGDWDVLRRWTGAMDRNISATGTIAGNETVLRVRGAGVYAAPASDVAKPRWVLEATDALVYGTVKVVGFNSATQVTVDIISPAFSTAATTSWTEGAFSGVRGYPAAVAMHEQRLVFAGTTAQPQTIWGSAAADFRNFLQTGLDDASYSYQIGAQQSNPILWLASQDGLIVGTQGDEWLLTGGGDKAITPSNVRTKRQSGYGSLQLQPLLVGSTVIFVQRGGLNLREYVFQWESQNYIAPSITQLFSHRTLSGIRAMTFSQNPEQILWVVTNDGKLHSCTYRREEQVVAWATHETAGEVESVAAVYGQPAGGDEVWVIVKRNGKRLVERLKSNYWADLESGEIVWHMDSAIEKTGTFSAVDGLEHLEGQTAVIIADGGEMPSALVIDGQVAVPAGTTHAAVGLPFESLLQPMPIEVPLQDGTAQGRRVKVTEVALLLYRTQAGSYADSPTAKVYPLVIRQSGDDANAPPVPFSGLKRLSTSGTYNDSIDVTVKSSSVMPLNVLSLIPTLNVYGT